MTNMYRSISVPVKAIQWNKIGDHKDVIEVDHVELKDDHGNGQEWTTYKLKSKYGSTEVNVGDWIVEFSTGEIHVVQDQWFKLRFEETKTFTKKELSAAVRMALEGDCE